MKPLTKPHKWLLSLVTAVVLLAPFWLQHPPDTFEMTFQRPVGGEDRRVQTVKLYCVEDASKGATEGNVWCQEVVLDERTDR